MSEKEKKVSFRIISGETVKEPAIDTETGLDVLTSTTTGAKDPSIDVTIRSQSVIGELTEAFDEISIAFRAFGDSVINFGNIIKSEATALGGQMKTSGNNIQTGIVNLIQKFKMMGSNLANNLKIS